MKVLLSILSLLVSLSTFADCSIYIDGEGYSDETERSVNIQADELPEKYKFSPKKMLVTKLEKLGYKIVNEQSEAKYEVTRFGGTCYPQSVFYECDYALSEIQVNNTQDPSSSITIKRFTEGMPVLMAILTGNKLDWLNTSGKSAYQKSLNAIPKCK